MPSKHLPAAAAILFALLPGSAPAQSRAQSGGYQRSQFMIQQQVIVRVPRLPAARAAATAKPVTWNEKKGPKCIALASLAGALVSQPRSVDLVQAGGARVRAHIDKRCPALDYYTGFYLRPTADGKICAGRDPVRTRAGRSCQIDRFRTLVAER